ncbi:c-type cytochrome [Chloroflexota bacterium]
MRQNNPTPQRHRPRDRKEEYEEHYEQAKSHGYPFFPYTVFKDAVMALVVVAVITSLALTLGVESEPIADPTSTTYTPRPEWYFLFFFKILTFFPGWMESIVNIVVPSVAVLLLLLVPFLDRSRERHPFKRPVVAGLGVAVVVGLANLTYLGAIAPEISPPPEQTPAEVLGQRVYRELNCAYCHSISGRGGAVGPDLSDIGSRLDREALLSYLRDPSAIVMNTLHPKLQFTEEELRGLEAYLGSLGAPLRYSQEAPRVFATHCSACHTIDGTGGKVGLDLSRVGSYRSTSWIAAFIESPKSVVSGATMTGFQGVLSKAQIDDLAAYLYTFKPGPQPTATATSPATPLPTLTPTPTPPPSPTHVVTPTFTPSPIRTPGVSPTPVSRPTHTITPTPTSLLVSYSKDLQPVLDTHCIICHGTVVLGGLDLRTHESAVSTGNHEPVIEPGSAEESILYKVLIGEWDGIPAMPPGSSLSPEEIRIIRHWIDQGAQDN